MMEHQLALMHLARLCGWWDLSREEEAALIGLAREALPLKLRSLSPAIQQRIEGLASVWEASRRAGEGPDWLRHQSNLYGGHSPLSILAKGDGAIDAVLDALHLPSTDEHFAGNTLTASNSSAWSEGGKSEIRASNSRHP